MTASYPLVAIDVSKSRLDGRGPDGKDFAIDNRADAISALARRWPPGGVLALEASGGYERQAVEIFHRAGFKVRVLNPCRVRRYAEATGRLAKTDRLDVDAIAAFASSVAGPAIQPDPARHRLCHLSRLRQALIAQRIALANRLDRMPSDDLLDVVQGVLESLKQAIKNIDGKIRAAIAQDPNLARQAKLSASVPGLGPAGIPLILAAFPELTACPAKNAVALAGLAPYARQSGNSERPAHVKGGRPALRSAFYLAALCVIRHKDKHFLPIYQRLLQRGKPKKVALIAIARKILLALQAVLKRQKPWQDRATS